MKREKKYMRNKKQVTLLLIFLFITALLFTACSSSLDSSIKAATKDANDPAVTKAFEGWFYKVIDDVKANPNYKRIPLDTKADQDWYLSLMFTAWDKKISKEEFVKDGLKRFPDYKESFEFVANKMP
jgi:hypothetical protein